MGQENFLWGAPPIHGELLKPGFDVSRATVSRYMPRRGYPPTQDLAHLPAEPGICNRHDRSWCIPCGFIERSLTLHPVPPYRSSNLTDWRDPHNGSTPVPPPPTALGDRTHWTMAGRRLSPYRSRASPRRKPPSFKNFARPTAIARMRQASRVLWGDMLHVCHERLAQKPII